jgi:hypothetical protein
MNFKKKLKKALTYQNRILYLFSNGAVTSCTACLT